MAVDGAGADAQQQPIGPQFVVEHSAKRLAVFGAVVLGLAWLLSKTSGSLWLNIPLSALVVGALTWISFGNSGQQMHGSSWRTRRFDGQRTPRDWKPPGSAAGTQKADARWRDKVRAPLVEHAWETLCGSIIQEFVYDTWYSYLTPDREFPADIRRALNSAFGELSARARHVDLRATLRDISELVMEQIDLFRYTRESIQRARAPGTLVPDMSSAAWDRALQQDMKAEGNLHPALCTPDGHYQVIRMVSEGLAAFVLDRSDSSKTMIRSVARELLASCVLRNLMFYFTPYTINKLVLGFLQQQEVAEKKRTAQMEQEQRQLMTSAKSESMKGHWDFEQRMRATIESEKMSAAQQRASKREARERLAASAAHRRGDSTASTTLTSPGVADELAEGYGSETSGAATSAGAGAAGATPSTIQLAAGTNQRPTPPEAYMQAAAEAALADVVLKGERMARSSQMGAQGAAGVVAAVGHEIADELRHPTEHGISRGTTEDEEAHYGHLRSPQNGDEALSRADLEHVHRFIGRPRAKVVAAELTTGGSKDIVMFVIRVADDTGEWTIARRFRHFESVHRSLRGYPAYKLKLPPKRIFFHAVSADFVEERREQLDTYMRTLLGDPNLCRTSEVWQFLSPWSDMYDLEDDGSFLRAVGTGLGTAKFNVKRFAGDIANELEVKRKKSVAALARGLAPPPELPPGITLQSRSRSSKNLHVMATGGSGSGQQGRRASSVSSSPTRRREDRSASPPLHGAPSSGPPSQHELIPGSTGRIDSISYNSSAAQTPSPALASPDRNGSTAHPLGGGASAQPPATPGATSNASINTAGDIGNGSAAGRSAASGPVATTAGRSDGGAAPGVIYGSGPNGRGLSQRSTSLVSGIAQRAGSFTDEMGGLARRAASVTVGQGTSVVGGTASLLQRAGKHATTGARNMASSFRQPEGGSNSGRNSPDASQRAATAAAAGAPPAGEPVQPWATWNERGSSSAPAHSGDAHHDRSQPDADVGAGDGGHLECGVAPRTNSMPGGNLHAVEKSALKPERPVRDGEGGGAGGLDWEDSAGISSPLYDIVDVVFELGSRGFFRRQIYAVGRQALSLVAGGAIDVFLLGQLRLLRQEHTLARAIHAIQAALWPGGTWFMYRPEYPRPKRTGTPAELAMRAEDYLTDFTPPPIDEDEIREALAAALKNRAPPALIRLVGRQAYSSGVQDMFDMLQSPTFVLQLGYGILEICCVNVFPEMKALFRQMEHGV